MNEMSFLKTAIKLNQFNPGQLKAISKLSDTDFNTMFSSLLKKEYFDVLVITIDDYGLCNDAVYKVNNAGNNRYNELKTIHRTHYFNEFRAWITLAIALAALAQSVYSLCLDNSSNNSDIGMQSTIVDLLPRP